MQLIIEKHITISATQSGLTALIKCLIAITAMAARGTFS